MTGNYAEDFEDVADSYASVNNYSDSFEESSSEGSGVSSVSKEDIHGINEVKYSTCFYCLLIVIRDIIIQQQNRTD